MCNTFAKHKPKIVLCNIGENECSRVSTSSITHAAPHSTRSHAYRIFPIMFLCSIHMQYISGGGRAFILSSLFLFKLKCNLLNFVCEWALSNEHLVAVLYISIDGVYAFFYTLFFHKFFIFILLNIVLLSHFQYVYISEKFRFSLFE